MMQKPSVMTALFQRSSGTGPKMGSRGYRKLRRWNQVFGSVSDRLGVRRYIYRRKEYIGGATGGPRGWRARLGGQARPLPRGLPVGCLTQGPSLLDHVRSKNHVPEGFIPFGLHLIFFFCETLKQAKKTAILHWALGQQVSPKNNIKVDNKAQ